MYFVYHRLSYSFATQHVKQGYQILIVGLGNPGPIYNSTRHNIGQQFVYYIGKSQSIKMNKEKCIYIDIFQLVGYIGYYKNIILFNPIAFMNLSGAPVKQLANMANIQSKNIIVAHDDLETMPGKCKVKIGGSANGHNGLKSIIQNIGSDFIRLKLGIGRPQSKEPEIVSDYVLSKVPDDQQQFIEAFKLLSSQLKF